MPFSCCHVRVNGYHGCPGLGFDEIKIGVESLYLSEAYPPSSPRGVKETQASPNTNFLISHFSFHKSQFVHPIQMVMLQIIL